MSPALDGAGARQRLEALLCRWPGLYAELLRRRPASLDKRAFLRLLQPGDVVFDVGANLGYFTRLFSRLVGPAGEVHAFEPVPATFERLAAAVAGAAARNVRLHRLAVSDRTGTAEVYVPGADHGQASLVPHDEGSWTSTAAIVSPFPCETVTLDSFAGEHGIGSLTLLKCDVEGAELPVLRGARGVLARCRPILHLEVSADWARDFGYGPADVVGFLAGLGYAEWYLLREDARRLADPAVELAREVSAGSANLLALVPEAHGERARRLTRRGGP